MATTLSVLALVVALAALAIAVNGARRRRPADGLDVPEDVPALRSEVAALRADLTASLRHLAVVRYDAFADMGGHLSWSVALLDDTGSGVVLTARCESWLVGHPEPEREALDRLVAFADAGADCLFAPGVRDPAVIAELVRAVAPRPLNVLVSSPGPELTLQRLSELGVRRISVGSALARVAWGAFMRAAKSIQEMGTFDGLSGLAPFADINRIFEGKER